MGEDGEGSKLQAKAGGEASNYRNMTNP